MHRHPGGDDDYPLYPSEAFQLLSSFLSRPGAAAADELRPYLPEVRAMAFYYRFMLDQSNISPIQRSLVRQFIAQLYAAQLLIRRYKDN
ncbi:MAG TPA: hypothetical protein VGB42_07720 [Candidatus Thermoplasmatota archaeon]